MTPACYEGCFKRAQRRMAEDIGYTDNVLILGSLYEDEVRKERRGRILFAAVMTILPILGIIAMVAEFI